jgi:hypothetical protein
MAKDSDQQAGALDGDRAGGLLSRLLAEEDEFDRRSLLRIGSWGVGAVGALIVAVMANQSSLGWRRERVAAADLARQAQQVQLLAHDSQNETRRLASAVDTLNSDRDRLYSRVTVLEQGLDSVTGAIAKQSGAANAPPTAPNMTTGALPFQDWQAAAQNPTQPAPNPAPVATTTAPPASAEKPREGSKTSPNVAMAAPVPTPAASPALLGPAKSMMGPPDPAAPKMVETPKPPPMPPTAAMAAVPPDPTTEQPAKELVAVETEAPKAAIRRTEFAVDLGAASSIGGLRALWRGLLKFNSELAELHPIIVVKESTTGLGMQLRLAAGPLQDAAAAAKICAVLLESERGCETTVFDGQRLAMAADDPPAGAKDTPGIKPVPAKRGYNSKHTKKEDAPAQTQTPPQTPPTAPAPKQDASALSSWFGSSKR